MERPLLEQAKVLITGGTGSFGRTMVDRLLATDCREIRILSRDEWKQDVMRQEIDDSRMRYFIGDVRNRESVDNAMGGVDYVFHAAALKQVPSCEFFPLEAVHTNVLGSANVIGSAITKGVRRVLCLSTDKAVFPINAMGLTKALMEKTVQASARKLQSGETTIASVRYGNVIFSRGSVIPLFLSQIQKGCRLTITEPSMTRFLLPLAQAVELVAFAFEHGEQGDLFIRKAPACTMGDLAQAMLNVFEVDLPVEVIGVRHGEKIFETLATAEELRRSEDMEDYFRIRMDDRDLNYAKYFTEGDPGEVAVKDYHSHNTTRLSVAQVEGLLLSLPEIQLALKKERYVTD